MGNNMTKEEVIDATIGVLANMSVPVRLDEQITKPVRAAIRNLQIALEMCKAENEANQRAAGTAQDDQETPITLQIIPGDGEPYGDGEETEAGQGGNPTHTPSGSMEGVNGKEGGEADGEQA